ncbi:unnamed protein product, partial [Prorocentrum cordatum]
MARLRAELGRMFGAARAHVEAMAFGGQVLESLALRADAGVGRGLPLWSVLASRAEAGLQCRLDWDSSRSARARSSRSMPFMPPLLVSVNEASRSWSLHGALCSEVPVVSASASTGTAAGSGGISDAGRVYTEVLPSGGRVTVKPARAVAQQFWGLARLLAGGAHVRAGPPDEEASQAILEYSGAADWRRWPGDLAALALLIDFARQATALEARAREADGRAEQDAQPLPRLEACALGRIRWRLPMPAGDDELFELVASASPEREARDPPAPAAGSSSRPGAARKKALVCSFRWAAPRQSFTVAAELSRQVCRTRDVAAALRTAAAVAELVRAVDDVTDGQDGWVAHSSVATAICVEFKGLVGVKVQSDGPGVVSCHRLPRPQDGERPQLAVVPNLDLFLRVLGSCGGSAAAPRAALRDSSTNKGARLEFEPGTLRARLAPLWGYLSGYCRLLQLYLILKSSHGGLWHALRKGTEDGHARGEGGRAAEPRRALGCPRVVAGSAGRRGREVRPSPSFLSASGGEVSRGEQVAHA